MGPRIWIPNVYALCKKKYTCQVTSKDMHLRIPSNYINILVMAQVTSTPTNQYQKAFQPLAFLLFFEQQFSFPAQHAVRLPAQQ